MKKNGLTALNLFMKFVGNIGMTYEVLFFDYFNDTYIPLETFKSWVSRGDIPAKSRLDVAKAVMKPFTSLNEKILRTFGSLEGLIEYFPKSHRLLWCKTYPEHGSFRYFLAYYLLPFRIDICLFSPKFFKVISSCCAIYFSISSEEPRVSMAQRAFCSEYC